MHVYPRDCERLAALIALTLTDAVTSANLDAPDSRRLKSVARHRSRAAATLAEEICQLAYRVRQAQPDNGVDLLERRLASLDCETDDTVSTVAIWRDRLRSAHTPSEQLVLLSDIGLSDRHLLLALPGVSARSLRRWRAGGSSRPPAERREQIDDVRALACLLLSDGRYDTEAIVGWLTGRNEQLEMERPLAALGAGRFAEVVAAAEEMLVAMPGARIVPIPSEPPSTTLENAAADPQPPRGSR